MSDTKTFYKVVPEKVPNPRNYRRMGAEDFEKAKKSKVEEGDSVCENHLGTEIWFSENEYIVRVKIIENSNTRDVFIVTPCTHEPTFGMDTLDGAFAQDAEEYILKEYVGFDTRRITLFEGSEDIGILDYIKNRGIGNGKQTVLFDAEKVAEYNNLYKKATDLIQGLIILHENMEKSLNWFQKRKVNKSIILFKKCIDLNPDSWNSMWLIGKAYQVLDDRNSALMWFEKAFEVQSQNPDVAREATLMALGLGYASKAIFYAEKAIEAYNSDSGLYSNYALALLIGKRGEEALGAIQKAIEMNPTDSINKSVQELIYSVLYGTREYPDKL